MTRALLALLLTGCMFPMGGEQLDGTWCSGKDVSTCCVAYTFGPGDAFAAEDCVGEYRRGTYAVDGDVLHIVDNLGARDIRWELGSGPVVRHSTPHIEETLRLEHGAWSVTLGRQQ